MKRQPLRPLQIIRSHNPRKNSILSLTCHVSSAWIGIHITSPLLSTLKDIIPVQIPTVMPCQNIAISPYFPLLDTQSDSQDGIFWAGLLSHGKSITFALIYLSNSSPYAFVTDIELLTWIPLTIFMCQFKSISVTISIHKSSFDNCKGRSQLISRQRSTPTQR